MAITSKNDDFFDESFFDKLRNRNSIGSPAAISTDISNKQRNDGMVSEIKKLYSQLFVESTRIRDLSRDLGNNSKRSLIRSHLSRINAYMQKIDSIIQSITIDPSNTKYLVYVLIEIKALIKRDVVPLGPTRGGYKTLFQVATKYGNICDLQCTWKKNDVPEKLSAAIKTDSSELTNSINDIINKLNTYLIGYSLYYEDSDDDDMPEVDEASVGDLQPITQPDPVVLRKEELEPSIDEAYNAINLAPKTAPIEEAGKEPGLDKASLGSIESWANKNLAGKGYIPFNKMTVTRSTTTKAINRKGEPRKTLKVVTITAKYKKNAICTIELSENPSGSSYKYAMDSSEVNSDFHFSGFLAFIHLAQANGFATPPSTNKQLKEMVQKIQRGKFTTKDSMVVEDAELFDYTSDFVYDESGSDVMPFTTNIEFVEEDGDPMIVWEDSDVITESMKGDRPIDSASLKIVEQYAEQNLKSSGYIPFSKLKIEKERILSGGYGATNDVYTAVYKKMRIVTLTVVKGPNPYSMSASTIERQGLKINPNFTLTGFIAGMHLIDAYGISSTDAYNKKLKKYADQIKAGKFKKHDRMIMEDADAFHDLLAENGIESVIAQYENCEEVVDVWEDWGDDEVITEAAKIDDDIKGIITTLNSKGYKTCYSCSGHPSARLKSDVYKDGIKDGKLYSTARVVFDKKYDFGSYPKEWEPKEMPDGKFGIYVKGPSYTIVKGMPKEQFYKWKKRYMYHLENWAKALPPEGSKANPDDKKKENEKRRYAEKGI